MRPSKIGMAAVSAAAVGLLALGGAAIANAADSSTPSSTATTCPSTAGRRPAGRPDGYVDRRGRDRCRSRQGHRGGQGRDSAVTITTVPRTRTARMTPSAPKAGAR